MANSCQQNFGKPSTIASPTIGFRFHTSDEGLEELLSDQSSISVEEAKETNIDSRIKLASLASDGLDNVKSNNEKSEAVGEVVKDNWSKLGRRSIVDSNYESPFSNPIETWRKLNEIKGKITKTVEEKISEMKIDRNVLSKSNRSKLISSKENSSVSDSEDTSESSKLSEQWKDAEDFNSSPTKASNLNLDILSTTLETAVENVKAEIESLESEAELRNRKRFSQLAEKIKISESGQKSEVDTNDKNGSLAEEVESGVEAHENLGPTEIEQVVFYDSTPLEINNNGSRTPSWGGSRASLRILGYFTSVSLSKTYTFLLIMGIGIYFFFTLPEFAEGFLLCLWLLIFWKKVEHYLFTYKPSNSHKHFVIPDYKSLPPLKVPKHKKTVAIWFNEYEGESYDPDFYSVSHTSPVLLELHKNILKLSRPKGKIQRRATYDEPEYKFTFISQRTYDIKGCNVYLLPEGLTIKRLFSKKYPIVIFLKPDSLISVTKKGKEVDEKELLEEETVSSRRGRIYLFARCDRQKEEWYRRILAATRDFSAFDKNKILTGEVKEKKNLDESNEENQGASFESAYFDEDPTQINEYLRYMSKFIDRSSHTSLDVEALKEVELGDSMYSSLQVQWLNAFVNRIIFNVLRSPYWINKIRGKVQKKLNSIRLPYYVEDVELTDMDLGTMGPTFHRVSRPYLDERGLWFDMDTTFEGLIKISIQTQLNLLKLQKGMEEENLSHHAKEEKGKKKPKERMDSLPIKESKEKSKIENFGKIPSSKPSVLTLNTQETYTSESTKDHENVENQSVIEMDVVAEATKLAEIVIEESLKVEEKNVLNEEVERAPSDLHIGSEREKSAIYNSEVEDSAESSEEEAEEEESPELSPPSDTTETPVASSVTAQKRFPRTRRSSKGLFRIFENVAQSRYFKSMAQSKYIQKAIVGVSGTKLKLTLEIKSLTGVIAINIPPPPSDRFWYGFREMPEINVLTHPRIGDKPVRFTHVKNFLHKKIMREIKKVMVVPNMIDFILPMTPPSDSSSSLLTEQPEFDDEEVALLE